jgi:DNA-binding SARP family transcriptional activator
MFGEFSLSYGSQVIDERSRRSEKTWLLLKYLICFMDRDIPLNELISVLWENEKIENPKNALKTLLHRLRNELKKLGMPDDESIIISRNKTYMFNKELDFYLDTHEFDKVCRATPSFDSAAELVKIYKGEYLSGMYNYSWTTVLREHYRNTFVKLLQDVITVLHENKRFHDTIMLCEKGIKSAPNNEFLQSALIKSLKHLNKDTAETHCFDDVLKELTENKHKESGAFYCDYEMFKHIYYLEMRFTERHSRNNSLFLITLVNKNGDTAALETLADDMDLFNTIIKESLRMSDVYTRYSDSQYLIMLHSTTTIAYPQIIERLTQSFINSNKRGENLPKTEFQPISEL